MTADRFWPTTTGEFTALRSLRPTVWEAERAPDGDLDPSGAIGGWTEIGPEIREVRPVDDARDRRPWWRPAIPPQHGAWAFLIVPVLIGFAITGASLAGWLFLGAWISAHPVGYFGGRALAVRARRGRWTRLARREARRAIPWAVLVALLGMPLALTRPWLLPAALGLAVLWAVGLVVADRRGERSMANDLLLVAQAAAAVPLAVAVVAGPVAALGSLAGDTLVATLLVCAYLTGSVLHVKSLLREAGNPTFRRLDVAWHMVALACAALVDPWWILGFGPALARSVAMRPGARPGAIGGVEAIVSVLVVVAGLLALPGG
jgi:YwiC-like protein